MSPTARNKNDQEKFPAANDSSEVHEENDEQIGNLSEALRQSRKEKNSAYEKQPKLNSNLKSKSPLPKIEEDSNEEGKSSPEGGCDRKLSKEIQDAVADVLQNQSSSSSTKEVSLLSGSTISADKGPTGIRKSPLTSQGSGKKITHSLRRSTSEQIKKSDVGRYQGISNKSRRYTTDELRSFKQKVMQENLEDLKRSSSWQSQLQSVSSFAIPQQDFKEVVKKQVAFAVDETVCGLVIGKGGVNVKKLEKTFDVEIIVNAKKSETATKRIVTIIGADSANIEKAREALDYQQVFIPILGYYQKKLVAEASADKFQRWRTESGVVRVEFENDLEDYDPITHRNTSIGHPGKISNREIIRQKKEQSNDLHNGFLRLVGTKEAVIRGQRLIEDELDRVDKIGAVKTALQPMGEAVQDENIRVHNVETNYSRIASQGTNPYYMNGEKGFQGSNNSVIYQLWQQQQQSQGTGTGMQYGAQPFYPQSMQQKNNGNNYRGHGSGYYHSTQNQMLGRPTSGYQKGNKYTKAQKNLDDMLLEGKLSVDEYAMKLSRHSNAHAQKR